MSCDTCLPPLRPDANKYTRGKLTVIAGSSRYTGSAVLAALASERMGSGYTLVVTAPEALPLVRAASPSLVAVPFDEWDAARALAGGSRHPQAICLGSGFQGDRAERALTLLVLQRAACPVLVDGTALGFLSGQAELAALQERRRLGRATVLTPHGGEAARLAQGLGMAEQAPRELGLQLAQRTGAVVALKGPDTYICHDGSAQVMDQGSVALAKAGSGDVLAGMVGSLLAQGMEAPEAAFAGCLIHAQAGNRAAAAVGERSVIATDIVDSIAGIIKGM